MATDGVAGLAHDGFLLGADMLVDVHIMFAGMTPRIVVIHTGGLAAGLDKLWDTLNLHAVDLEARAPTGGRHYRHDRW